MSGSRSTPIGTPVVLAPGKIVLVGEYAALADGSTVEAAFGCYAKAQFIPQMDLVMTLVTEIIEQVRTELAEVAPALPPGSVLLTNADFRGISPVAAGPCSNPWGWPSKRASPWSFALRMPLAGRRKGIWGRAPIPRSRPTAG